nr:sensor domain-containing protein [Mycobacterium eburneum]
MRNWAAVCGVCLVLTGCSTMVDGRAVPADTDGPKPVPKSAFTHALLDTGEISDIMGASAMTVKTTLDELHEEKDFPDTTCTAAWMPVENSAYADSGWTSLRGQVLADDTDAPTDHYVIQALVGFKSHTEAQDFFEKTAKDWTSCGDQTFTNHHHSDNTDTRWDFGETTNEDSTLTVTQSQQNTPGWGCQRAMRVSNNVAIDVIACKMHADDEGTAIIDQIDARLPSV